MPAMPLIRSEADLGLAFYDQLQLPDVPEKPKLGDATGQWFREIVEAAFGSWEPEIKIRHIRDIFILAPKGSSKTSYSAGLMVAAMLMNRRPRTEMMFVGPTQAISDRAYEQASGMIDESAELRRRFRPRDHIKTIEDLTNQSEMTVKTFDLNILTGSIPVFVLVDELHLLGKSAHTTKVLRQIRGGLDKTEEGLLVITTTQSDEEPVGAFLDELRMARNIRDGKFKGQIMRPMLPILYEFPPEIAKDRKQWENVSNWPIVQPNLGRSVRMDDLIAGRNTEQEKGEHAMRVWASQHLNIEIGVGLAGETWEGAEFWDLPANVDTSLTLEKLMEICEVVVVGIDGGGLDDLLGLAVLGRIRDTGKEISKRKWVLWVHAWAHDIVKKRRKEIVAKLEDFEKEGSLTFVSMPGDDVQEVAEIVMKLDTAGLLPVWDAGEGGKRYKSIGVDAVGIGDIVDALAVNQFDIQRIEPIGQGWKLNGAIKSSARKLAGGNLLHSGTRLMNWCVGNAKSEPVGSAVKITKEAAGKAKIDPLAAMFDCVELMGKNPEAARSIYEEEDIFV